MPRPTPNPRLAAVEPAPIARAFGWRDSYDGRHGPLIDCSQAVPDHAPPPPLAERLGAAAASADAARYGPILGDAALRDVYAKQVSAFYGVDLGPGRVAITAGCNQAFFAAMLGVATAGDAVVLPVPWYFNHQMSLAMTGVEPRLLPATEADGFLPTADGLRAVLDEKCRAVLLVSPNNPTGAIYPPELLTEIFDICVERGLYLILDETYRDFLPPGSGATHDLFSRPEAADHLVSLYSFSKAYAIPGHRLGAIIAGEAFLASMQKAIDCIQICPPRPGQAALVWAIPAMADWRRESAAAIAARGEAFAAALAPIDGWEIVQLGAYFAYVRHPYEGVPAEEIAAALVRELGILVLPGSFFGPGQEAYLRFAVANVAADRIAEIARRLAIGLGAAAATETRETIHG
ncbi:aminotransferase [Aurantimonas sp. HBX-1]|uniref:aminotransferase n=1 Tax=Aurantimonas sp. HBX-1 TaxID=2906072 RepID=UPI001F4352C3|nr:aminotransferase [Aurantimonas sp. HBX-1]UIJ73119.1 aminotransferase [Aurantimonas sp. HBX-1]